jgi:2'-5' RNA ligase
MLRLFIAIAVPAAVREALAQAQRRLESAGVALRWVRPEGIHLTLAFLGNVAEERVAALEEAMTAAAGRSAPLNLAAVGLGRFPPRGAPRVLWAGLGGEVDALRRVQRDLDAGLRDAGFDLEDRAFRPHVTLGRAPQRPLHGLSHTLDAALDAESHRPNQFGRWRAEEIVLMRSQLRPTGSIYTALATAPLGQDHEEDANTPRTGPNHRLRSQPAQDPSL